MIKRIKAIFKFIGKWSKLIFFGIGLAVVLLLGGTAVYYLKKFRLKAIELEYNKLKNDRLKLKIDANELKREEDRLRDSLDEIQVELAKNEQDCIKRKEMTKLMGTNEIIEWLKKEMK